MLNRPPQILLTALSKLQTNHIIGSSKIADFLAEVGQKIPQQASGFARPAQEDHLYLSDYHHVDSESMTCDACNPTQIVSRASRGHDEPVIHYGLIASASKLVRDSKLQDRLGRELGIYCVEMEAAGLNNFPCLVVRGICDYADSHKNRIWQQYAAVVAAAYAKELLLCTSVRHIDQVQTVRDSLSKGMLFWSFALV
jgi:nucleoside phosphorylase